MHPLIAAILLPLISLASSSPLLASSESTSPLLDARGSGHNGHNDHDDHDDNGHHGGGGHYGSGGHHGGGHHGGGHGHHDQEDGKGCTASSFGTNGEPPFQWSITGFEYHASWTFSTPAHQNSWGYVSFNLSNPSLSPSVSTCSATSNTPTDFFFGTMTYNCSTPDASTIETGGSGGKATFDWSVPTGLLHVNQTWTCRDKDPRYPIFFTAYGGVNLTLECENTFWQNPNWTMGQIYSDRQHKCKPIDLNLKPSVMTAIA